MTNTLIHLDREEVLQLEKSLSREWFEFDGLGGFASNTVVMCPTRRYHGLLVTRPDGSTKRHVFLSRFEESLHGRGKSFALSMARYPNAIAPHGFRSLENFELVPFPHFEHQIGRVTARREIMVVRGQRTVLCRYHFTGAASDIELRLRPLLAYREADLLTRENLALDPRVRRTDGALTMQPYASLPPLHLRIGGADLRFEADPVWYRQLYYAEEIKRGYPGEEDNFSPGILHVPLDEEIEFVVACSIEGDVRDPMALWEEESYRRKTRVAPLGSDTRGTLRKHALDYLYRDSNGRLGVIAGFPWFGEWGRDTFVAAPGLTLSVGELDACTEILTGTLPYLRAGLMPNVFGLTADDSYYGSADAALWFARAVRLWERAGGDAALLKERFLPALEQIATSYEQGTELNVHVTSDGLLYAGHPGTNATWMDATTPQGPVTSRHGCAVELNALWYFLVAYLAKLHRQGGDKERAKHWSERRKQIGAAFLERFWLEREGYLADGFRDGERDTSIRPNQVIAAALEFSPLSREQRLDVVHSAEVGLVTPRGLRTLSPRNPAYLGKYQGGPVERDLAYHQGSVWPWLIGFFAEAYLRAHRRSKKRNEFIIELLDGFEQHLRSYGQEHVSELFDGDPPHRAGGAPAQAWSLAEILRAYAMIEEGA